MNTFYLKAVAPAFWVFSKKNAKVLELGITLAFAWLNILNLQLGNEHKQINTLPRDPVKSDGKPTTSFRFPRTCVVCGLLLGCRATRKLMASAHRDLNTRHLQWKTKMSDF